VDYLRTLWKRRHSILEYSIASVYHPAKILRAILRQRRPSRAGRHSAPGYPRGGKAHPPSFAAPPPPGDAFPRLLSVPQLTPLYQGRQQTGSTRREAHATPATIPGSATLEKGGGGRLNTSVKMWPHSGHYINHTNNQGSRSSKAHETHTTHYSGHSLKKGGGQKAHPGQQEYLRYWDRWLVLTVHALTSTAAGMAHARLRGESHETVQDL